MQRLETIARQREDEALEKQAQQRVVFLTQAENASCWSEDEVERELLAALSVYLNGFQSYEVFESRCVQILKTVAISPPYTSHSSRNTHPLLALRLQIVSQNIQQ
jgi:hypothetical protein